MAWTFQQPSTKNSNGIAASLSLAYPSNVTQGTLLVVFSFVKGGTSITSATVTDSAGNSWTQDVLTVKNATDSSFLSIWHAISNSSGPNTVTITPNTGTPSIAMAISEFSPGSPPTSYTITTDGTNNAVFTANTTTPSAGSIPVAGSNELVIAAIGEASASWSGTYTAGTGFTLDQSLSAVPTIATEYILSQSSAIAGAFTTSQSRPWDAVGASFSATLSGGSSSFVFPPLVIRPRFEPAIFE